ncbi:MAG: hypothetical protein NXI04_23665 [Planctomycetaceae bacterium]|nr:hypothetical protein [Planctomycetaceae bacterium]
MIESELESQQQLLLWLLMVSDDGGMFLTDVKLSFESAAKRTALMRQGLTEEAKRKRATTNRDATYIELTEKGWAWCQDHLGTPLQSKSPMVAVVLNRLREILRKFFRQQNHCSSIGELVLISSQAPTEEREHDLQEIIEQECLKAGGGRENVRVRLAELRPRLSQFTRQAVDDELLALERTGRLSIWRLNDPTEITAADREAAIVSGGRPNHIVYYGENS